MASAQNPSDPQPVYPCCLKRARSARHARHWLSPAQSLTVSLLYFSGPRVRSTCGNLNERSEKRAIPGSILLNAEIRLIVVAVAQPLCKMKPQISFVNTRLQQFNST